MLTNLFNGVLLASHLSNYCNIIYVLRQTKLQAVRECECRFGHQVHLEAFRQQGPVATTHARVPQALNQRNVLLELLN